MITASLEPVRGVDNLWKQGRADGFKPYPNYGQYIPKNYFKAFQHAFPFLWADKRYWFMDPKKMPWDLVLPFVRKYNEKRELLLAVVFAVLDESMSGWRPKTSKTGGLPNITHEPRKPVPLGTMFRNAVEGFTGIFAHHDIVEDLTSQRMKKYLQEDNDSLLPMSEPIKAHVAEVLRQAEGAKVEKGGWVGGDAWFGSINSCVELKARLDIYSSFIVKNNLDYFPMKVLHAILMARYPDRPAGHWVTMKVSCCVVHIIFYEHKLTYSFSTSQLLCRRTFPASTCTSWRMPGRTRASATWCPPAVVRSAMRRTTSPATRTSTGTSAARSSLALL